MCWLFATRIEVDIILMMLDFSRVQVWTILFTEQLKESGKVNIKLSSTQIYKSVELSVGNYIVNLRHLS